jgi:septal ring-binding cell division protein DamX
LKIQVNSDKTIKVDASLIRFVETEAGRSLERFAGGLTRVEVHLSDVDSTKRGQADKRCLIEARPRGARPLSASANAPKLDSAVRSALGKLRRALTTFFERAGISTKAPAVKKAAAPVQAAPVKKVAVKKAAVKKAAAKKVAAKKAAAVPAAGPKKKQIYQARRKNWPAR